MALKGQIRNEKQNYFMLKKKKRREKDDKYCSIRKYVHTMMNWIALRARFAGEKMV